MRRNLTLLTLALVCAPIFAGTDPGSGMAFGFSVGYQHPQHNTKIETTPNPQYNFGGLLLNDGGEVGLELSVIHSERFSTRWGMIYSYQSMAAPMGYHLVVGSLHRAAFGGYLQGNFNLIQGVGKAWYLTAGGVYNAYSITANNGDSNDGSNDLDKTSKAGVVFGTGVTFNGKNWRWSPELLIQKVGIETTGIFRLHCQVQFSSR
jgi:hypothetical protein